MCRNLSSNQFAGILDGNITRSVNLQMLLERNNITGVVNFPSEFLNAK
jgi:polyhydroxyalkanoate synthesis regulator protein